MDRYLEVAHSATPPSAPPASSGYPTNGNPQTATPATEPGEWWFHMVTEELRAVIVAAGLTPDHADVTQLSQAIQALFVANQKAVVINNATFEASVADGEVVRWDSGNSRFDEAVADGTSNNRAVGVADVTNSKVYLYGECPLFSGLTPGARYYLSSGTAGAITTTAPTDAVMVGIAKSATVLWVDIDSATAVADASETIKGIIELATAAEAQALTDTVRAITPATLASALQGSNQSLSASGYQKLPGGLILQWGISASIGSSSSGTVTFPIAFPTAVYSVISNGISSSSTETNNPYVNSVSTTQFTIVNPGVAKQYYWLAIGK